MNPLEQIFPGGLSLSTILGAAGAVGAAITQLTGNPIYGAIGAALAGVVLPEEPKK